MFYFLNFKSDLTNILVYFLFIFIFLGFILNYLKRDSGIEPFTTERKR
jgi:hypothetical protein